MLEHLQAFNAHDTDRLLAGLTADAVWVTGVNVLRGRDSLLGMFDAGLWSWRPTLTLTRMIASEHAAAVELHETLLVDGELRAFAIAVFFTFRDQLITTVRVYREGSADLD